MAHDDGKNFRGWPEAEIVILGVSRVYKTPLSQYLAMLGFKVLTFPSCLASSPAPNYINWIAAGWWDL
ncbi:MAG TPA: kinase/pyrophosphorylase [Anaerolineae bacterium]|nr:kinase/pyrophosphorylase [Anaerolineae bacterium]